MINININCSELCMCGGGKFRDRYCYVYNRPFPIYEMGRKDMDANEVLSVGRGKLHFGGLELCSLEHPSGHCLHVAA